MFYDESMMMSDMLKKKCSLIIAPCIVTLQIKQKKLSSAAIYINLVSRAFSVLVNFGTIGWNNASLHPPQ
jgi:hypothetical protein